MLQNLLKETQVPSFIQRNPYFTASISKINVWASKQKTISKLHYDFYENFLWVRTGRKIVYLWPPNDKLIQPCCNSSFLTSHEGTIDYSGFEAEKKNYREKN